jgi:hypothetical protein
MVQGYKGTKEAGDRLPATGDRFHEERYLFFSVELCDSSVELSVTKNVH